MKMATGQPMAPIRSLLDRLQATCILLQRTSEKVLAVKTSTWNGWMNKLLDWRNDLEYDELEDAPKMSRRPYES